MEVDFKVHFAERYFDKNLCQYDVNFVDIVLNTYPNQHRNESMTPLLYIESKDLLTRESEPWRRALAQTILTNKKQKLILSRVALIYRNNHNDDCLDLIDCSDNSIMYNNDFNWDKEKPNNPTRDAVDRIFDRIRTRISLYVNREISELYQRLKTGDDVHIHITLNNFNIVYNEWCHSIRFANREVQDEQDRINLFLVDLLNGTHYEHSVKTSMLGIESTIETKLIREGTDLNKYTLTHGPTEITYDKREVYVISDEDTYESFWRKYQRPPQKEEFLKILEQSARLYTDSYRRDTGGFYTPSCFVQLQNRKLAELGYNMDEYIVCDPCCGVGNLENEFGKDFKQHCYLATLERMDVDICKIKGFDNVVQFDFLKEGIQEYKEFKDLKDFKIFTAGEDAHVPASCESETLSFPATPPTPSVRGDTAQPTQACPPLSPTAFPKWKYYNEWIDITEICRRENRKLMVIMNPPYVKQKGYKNNLAIEFFNKVLAWQPDVIVFYYMTQSFLRDEIKHYIRSGYKITSHVLTNAKTAFQVSEWPVSQVIFDRHKGEDINPTDIPIERYEIKQNEMVYIKTYHYNNTRPYLIDEIEKKMRDDMQGAEIGLWSYLNSTLNITNKGKKTSYKITTKNLVWCLLSAGINFNTHHKYFERNDYVYRGCVEDIPRELFTDSIAFSLFYKKFAFTNKGGYKNYLMPFGAELLGCNPNALNVLHLERGIFEKPPTPLKGGTPNDLKDFNDFKDHKNLKDSPSPQGRGQGGEVKSAFFDFRRWLQQFDFSPEAQALFQAALKIFRWYHQNPRFAKTRDWNDSWYDITNAIMGKDDSSFQTLDAEEDTRFLYKVRTTKGTRGFGRNTIKSAVASEDLPMFYHFFDVRDTLARKINKELFDAGLLLWERENIY